MNKPKIKTVAVYARVSTNKKKDDPKRQDESNQLRELRAHCKREGWKIYGEYIDRESGGTAERKEFKRMFEDARNKNFDLVVFWALDRFSREGVRETLNHLQRLDDYGVAYRSHTEQYIDSAGMFRDAIISILATLAKQERVRLSERTKAGLAKAKAKGKTLGRSALPLKTRQKIYNHRHKDGMSMRAIARKVDCSVGTVATVVSGDYPT